MERRDDEGEVAWSEGGEGFFGSNLDPRLGVVQSVGEERF